ncbi:MAG: DUF4255 domain-containing protein [Thermomicrobia bacterium]|nr:DUF4255 domain-containing protein [Thermomicrobia bacterium]
MLHLKREWNATLETRESGFVVRVWEERRDDPDVLPIWRLSATNIRGKTAAYFTSVASLCEYLALQSGVVLPPAAPLGALMGEGRHALATPLDADNPVLVFPTESAGTTMNSPLALAAMTFILKDMLDNRIVQRGVTADVGSVAITALPPDRIATGSDERSQLNVFLYRVTPYTAWRNNGSSMLDAAETRRAPMALDLHYLISAYGEHDFHAEILLGYAMQILHETPILTHGEIVRALASIAPSAGSALPPAYQAIAAANPGEAFAEVRISPEFLNAEETSKLWSALQARYRPSKRRRASRRRWIACGRRKARCPRHRP